MKEIVIDGEEYVKKSSIKDVIINEDVKRFSFSKSYKIICSLKKIFPLVKNPISEEMAIKNLTCIVSPCMVSMVSGKSEEGKRILSNFMDIEVEKDDYKELPKLSEYKEEGISSFSLEYLKPFIETLSITDDKVKIKVAKDYPITLENEDFIFIIAPRVGDKE